MAFSADEGSNIWLANILLSLRSVFWNVEEVSLQKNSFIEQFLNHQVKQFQSAVCCFKQCTFSKCKPVFARLCRSSKTQFMMQFTSRKFASTHICVWLQGVFLCAWLSLMLLWIIAERRANRNHVKTRIRISKRESESRKRESESLNANQNH